MIKLSVTKTNINSDILCKEITDHMDLILPIWFGELAFHPITRARMLESMEYAMEHWRQQGRIEQFHVWCDCRNNPPHDLASGVTRVDITYRQTNCLNVSSLVYKISTQSVDCEVVEGAQVNGTI